MPTHRILQINALATAACGLAMLAARPLLHPLFGLASPILLDAVALGFLGYAGVLAVAAARQPVARRALLAFSVADGMWVVASALLLLGFWGQLAPIARALVIAVAAFCEVAATLQFRAAGRPPAGAAQPA